MSLMLHCGADAIDYDGLRQLTTPEPTATHVPIPHYRVVDMLCHTLGFYGHEVTERHFGVTEDGMRFFGLLSLRSPYTGYEDTVGLRNSHDKKFPIGISFGSRVFVCDNLAFIGDHVIKRKHTANAKRDLPSLVSQLIEPLTEQREAQARTFQRYKTVQLPEQLADHAIMSLYRNGVINIQRVPQVLEQFHEPKYEDWGDHTAWTLFNATTHALEGRVAENPAATAKLHTIIDGVCQAA